MSGRGPTEGTTSPSRGESGPDRGELTRGSYILLIRVPRHLRLGAGALGELALAPGGYVYVGSAMGGLGARLARHFGKRKRRRWHIDYLLERAELVGAVLLPSPMRLECSLARAASLIPGVSGVRGFGSGDCGCPGHLFFLGKLSFGRFLMSLGATAPLSHLSPSIPPSICQRSPGQQRGG